MKKLILKIISVLAAFFLGIVFMSYMQSAGNRDLTDSMASATLPLVYLEQGGRQLNLMHGYTQPMNGSLLREAVLPLPEDREIELLVQCPNTEAEQLFYEVRSLDTKRLVEDAQIMDYTREDDFIRARFQLKDLLDEGQEYLLVIRLELERGQEAFYYTRLINLPEHHLEECMDFITMIHEALFDKENTVNITSYLEPDTSADNGTLAYVNIHSRYKQLIWDEMEVQLSSPVRTYLIDLEGSIAAVRLEYEVNHLNEKGKTERYQVQEAYRVRYTEQRMYLLNYERTAERIFDPELEVFTENSIELGILNTEVEYRKNEEENIIAFVQNGDLWCYDVAQNKLSYVFGFRDGDDLRCSYEEHEIKIIDVDESGSMNFLVYGYMNRGRHEGRTGISVYTYNALTNSVEERIFIESSKPFRILKSEVGKLAYVNKQEILYLYLQNSIWRIDLKTRSFEEVVTGIAEECCMMSEDGRLAAWQRENSLNESEAVELLNLETNRRRTVQAEEGFYIRALGFMGTDFIYGEARKEDVAKSITGSFVFPMGYVAIQDENGVKIREFSYEQQGKYAVDISIENNRTILDCVAKDEAQGYTEALPELITKNTAEVVEKIALNTKNSGVKKREFYFELTESRKETQMKRLMPRLVLFEGSRSLQLEKTEEDLRYFVYAYTGRLAGAYGSANEAVITAYEQMGVVVDSSQSCIWRRGGRKTRTELTGLENLQQRPEETSMQAAIEILLSGENNYADTTASLEAGRTPYEILSENLDGRVLDLSGCSVNMILYYVSQGYPVLAIEGRDTAELITGYDPQNVILTNPITGEAYRKGMNDSTQMFEELGNLFVVCLPPENL
ncbi:hypothetical protein VV089_18155 [Candidatus Merdisoma sp. JLR.KK011]|uniref:hypothetical protein n=1 Tax=Candidatus Merdisoma sp. JLR.KK011 TaxID=3114299 RepID=UPI002FF33A9F